MRIIAVRMTIIYIFYYFSIFSKISPLFYITRMIRVIRQCGFATAKPPVLLGSLKPKPRKHTSVPCLPHPRGQQVPTLRPLRNQTV